MFVGDVAPTNIWGYVHQFYATDEHTGARGCGPGAEVWPIYSSVNR
jgi:hypothetical protein